MRIDKTAQGGDTPLPTLHPPPPVWSGFRAQAPEVAAQFNRPYRLVARGSASR